MKRSMGKLVRSSVVAVVNFCFLCGAGHLVDLGAYIFKRSADRCHSWWHSMSTRINRYIP